MIRPVLKLYITGQTPNSERAVANLRRICDEHFAGDCDLSVIDVLERPEVAEAQRVFATPTLVKEVPAPSRRVIGDLTETQKVLSSLDLDRWNRIQPATSQPTAAPAGRGDGA